MATVRIVDGKNGKRFEVMEKKGSIPNTTGYQLTRQALAYIAEKLPGIIPARCREQLRHPPIDPVSSMHNGFLATQQLLDESHKAMERSISYMESSKDLFGKAKDAFQTLVLGNPHMEIVRKEAEGAAMARWEETEKEATTATTTASANDIDALATHPDVIGESPENSEQDVDGLNDDREAGNKESNEGEGTGDADEESDEEDTREEEEEEEEEEDDDDGSIYSPSKDK